MALLNRVCERKADITLSNTYICYYIIRVADMINII